MIETLLFIFGFLYLIEKLIWLIQTLKSLLSKPNLSKYSGKWALVTACTDGIGYGFVQVLAKNGINIVQVGRNPSKLSQISQDLISKYGIQVKNIQSDFANSCTSPSSFFLNIQKQCEDIEVSILINNVGFGGKLPFISDCSSINNQNSLNLWPIVYLTRLFIKSIEKNSGFIINLSSLAGLSPSACASTYSAGKAFDHVFSSTVSLESSAEVLCLMPAFVSTPMTQRYKFKPLEISKEECAESALKDVGALHVTCGHWKHWICCGFFSVVSGFQVYLEWIIQ